MSYSIYDSLRSKKEKQKGQEKIVDSVTEILKKLADVDSKLDDVISRLSKLPQAGPVDPVDHKSLFIKYIDDNFESVDYPHELVPAFAKSKNLKDWERAELYKFCAEQLLEIQDGSAISEDLMRNIEMDTLPANIRKETIGYIKKLFSSK